MHFDYNNALMGATIQTYLLEKSRLVHQDTSERNYHIFYQLIRGLGESDRAQIGLDDAPEAYHYLRQSGCTSIQDHDDSADCKRLQQVRSIVSARARAHTRAHMMVNNVATPGDGADGY